MTFLFRHKGEISFIIMLSGWVLTLLWENPSALFFILQSGFEAGTVGGAADWLAVKMIFDEIKIGKLKLVPASGIVPRKQKEIAKGAGKLVAEEWLSPKSIQSFLEKWDIVEALTQYLREFKNSLNYQRVKNQIFDVLQRQLKESSFRNMLHEEVKLWWGKTRHLPSWTKGIPDAKVEQVAHKLIPIAADRLVIWLTSPESFEMIRSKIEAEQGFFSKIFFDSEELTEKIVTKLSVILRDIESDETHPLRLKMITGVLDAKHNFESSSEKTWLEIEVSTSVDESIETLIEKMLSGLESYLSSQISDTQSGVHRFVDSWFDDIISKMRGEWKVDLNRKISDWLTKAIESNHYKIADLVEENITRLSPDEIKEQFKTRTYDDMQWIRVNGAVAGFVIGIILGLIRLIK